MQSMGVTQKSYSYCKWKSCLVLSLALADIALSTDACFNLLHATSSDPEGCKKSFWENARTHMLRANQEQAKTQEKENYRVLNLTDDMQHCKIT